MARWAVIACVAVAACSAGATPNPFSGVTSDADEDEGEESTGRDTLSTISESASATAPDTTSGVLPETTGSSTDAPTSESGAGTSTGEVTSSGSSGGAESSSSTGGEQYGMCATSNTLTSCAVAGSNSMPFMDDMLCTTNAMFMNPEVYDFFVIYVASDDCVFVQVDNAGGDADVMAYVVDADEAYYGLEPDYSELDDEIDCTVTPWNGYACPRAGVVANADGPLTIAVGQWDTTPDCTDNAPYTLWVAINGTDVDMTEALVLQDHVIDPLTCP